MTPRFPPAQLAVTGHRPAVTFPRTYWWIENVWLACTRPVSAPPPDMDSANANELAVSRLPAAQDPAFPHA